MEVNTQKKKCSFLFLGIILSLLAFVQTVAAQPEVRVQPSGEAFSNAYVITGETRTYFGNVEGGTPPYEYKWEFSNGGDTTFAAVSDPRFISVDHVYNTAGTHWARLTLRDSLATQNSAIINLQVIAAADDDLNRQKNSAIDRGLRYTYLHEQVTSEGSWWPGSGSPIASTGMAMIAFENHGHNLQSPDSDIYKKSVEEGIRYLLNHAYNVLISSQLCIGDPEAGDGDSDNDGLGIIITPNAYSDVYWDEMYIDPIAVLAIVNSCDKATAQTRTAVTTSGDVNGMTLWDIIVDAKDLLAYAQADNCGQSGWRYVRNEGDVDNSVSQWPILALLEARNRWDININPLVISKLDGWLAYSQNPDSGGFGYTDPWNWVNFGKTGAGLIMLNYCGYDETNARMQNALGFLDANWDVPGTSDGNIGHFYAMYAFYKGMKLLGLDDLNGRNWEELYTQYLINRQGQGGSSQSWSCYSADWNSYVSLTTQGLSVTNSNAWKYLPTVCPGTFTIDWGNGSPTEDYPGIDWYCSYDYAYIDGLTHTYPAGGTYTVSVSHGGEPLCSVDVTVTPATGDYWNEEYYYYDTNFATSTALAILAPAVAGLPPVADAGGPYPDINPGQTVNLDGTGSHHLDPSKSLIKWEWDFNAEDGLWWDTKSSPDPGEGAIGQTATTSYPDIGIEKTYTVTLRVTDNSTPAMTDTDTATVKVTTGNVPPVAVTNGPWAGLPGQTITFDGSASYDPNSCTTVGDPRCLGDSIVLYEWDLDGDGIFNGPGDGTPVIANRSIVERSFPEPLSRSATLCVTDSFGLKSCSSAQFNIISIAVVYGRQYNTCFKQQLNRFEERLGINVMFKNLGNSPAENLVMTLTKTPTNLQILKGVANLGNLAANEEKWTFCNPTAKSAEIELKFDRRIAPTGEWRWKADFDFEGRHYVVDNIPPLGP